MRGCEARARHKRTAQRELLVKQGIDVAELKNIVRLDAALCAYTAHLAATGAALRVFGEEATGVIVVPPRAAPSNRHQPV